MIGEREEIEAIEAINALLGHAASEEELLTKQGTIREFQVVLVDEAELTSKERTMQNTDTAHPLPELDDRLAALKKAERAYQAVKRRGESDVSKEYYAWRAADQAYDDACQEFYTLGISIRYEGGRHIVAG